jgi:hypothetical protein
MLILERHAWPRIIDLVLNGRRRVDAVPDNLLLPAKARMNINPPIVNTTNLKSPAHHRLASCGVFLC